MTDHRTEPIRPLWTDADLDRALDALHADDAGERLGTARATLDDALAHQGVPMLTPSRQHDGTPPRPIRTRRWVSAAIAAGVAVVAAAAVAFTGPFGQHHPSQHKRAAVPDKTTVATVPGGSTMRAAATKTVQFGDPKLGPGQYLYVKDISSEVYVYAPDHYTLAWRRTTQTEKWVPYDQSGTWVQHFGQIGSIKWLVGTKEQIAKHGAQARKGFGDPPAWTEAACGDFYHVYSGGTPRCVQGNEVRKQPNTELLKQVPQDPKKYLAWAANGKPVHAADVEQQVMQTSAMLLSSGVIPAKLRGTIYRALAMLPNLKVTERVANLAGRRGTALGLDAYGDREEIIIDPDTGQYIGMRITALSDSDVPAGTVRDLDAMTVSVVDKPRQRP
ncbi:hypothetical protein Athai_39600 [Actinocatenispora thailandica]|uniref:CU044_5270 family protein n=1 Tax=Actinocatenispora thailandica TaxID=227318 RepID=A0A7R7HXR1_9ACTN|nr:CU044_5270 family protein [Actinocatenispora thailandica]BCJ36457.1 hypothetical protein Athai_39600 [Actinocatenispora thailandica]